MRSRGSEWIKRETQSCERRRRCAYLVCDAYSENSANISSGMRDFSLMTTPPKGRKEVIVKVSDMNKEEISTAVTTSWLGTAKCSL